MKYLLYLIYDYFTFNQMKYLRMFRKLDKMRGQELLDFQLKKIVQCCSSHGLSISNWKEFKNLPVTTKKDLPNKIPTKKFKKHETSGSTGEPRVIYVPNETWYRKDAIFTRSWEKIGRKKTISYETYGW